MNTGGQPQGHDNRFKQNVFSYYRMCSLVNTGGQPQGHDNGSGDDGGHGPSDDERNDGQPYDPGPIECVLLP
jgi:hypothetical protein